MAFDPRSRERLEALGRRLPQPLPAPQPDPPPPARRRQHAIETEDDPAQLFRELMRASPDGSVPDHLLQRLRELERPPLRRDGPGSDGPGSGGPGSGGRALEPGGTAPEADDPYRMFQELLLEEQEEPMAPPGAQPTPGKRRRSRASR